MHFNYVFSFLSHLITQLVVVSVQKRNVFLVFGIILHVKNVASVYTAIKKLADINLKNLLAKILKETVLFRVNYIFVNLADNSFIELWIFKNRIINLEFCKFWVYLFRKIITAKVVKSIIKRNKTCLSIKSNSFNYSFCYIIKYNSSADNEQNNFA